MNKLLASLAIVGALTLGACGTTVNSPEGSIAGLSCATGEPTPAAFLANVRKDNAEFDVNVKATVVDKAVIAKLYRGEADLMLVLEATNKATKETHPLALVAVFNKGCYLGANYIRMDQVLDLLK